LKPAPQLLTETHARFRLQLEPVERLLDRGKLRVGESPLAQVRAAQVRAFEIGAHQMRGAHHGGTEIRSNQLRGIEVGAIVL